MIKTIEFGEQQVQFNTSFAWTFVYKSQFGVDAAKVLMPVIKDVYATNGKEQSDEEEKAMDLGGALLEQLGFSGITGIAWSMARLCDKTIPEPLLWVTSYGDDFPVMDLVSELIPEAITSCFATKKSKAPVLQETKRKAPKRSM